MPNNLTEHFTLEEFTYSDTALAHRLDNQPPLELIDNLVQAAKMMERIRTALGNVQITVNSAYRSPPVNTLVGSTDHSDHVRGQAVDMVAPACGSPYEVALRLSRQVDELKIGQLIFEVSGKSRWVHVSTRIPDNLVNRVLTIANGRTQVGIQAV